VFSPDDPVGGALRELVPPAFADWRPGTLVRHERYGVGTVRWIRRDGEKTRASIHFAGYGQKTLILEVSGVRKLERGSL